MLHTVNCLTCIQNPPFPTPFYSGICFFHGDFLSCPRIHPNLSNQSWFPHFPPRGIGRWGKPAEGHRWVIFFSSGGTRVCTGAWTLQPSCSRARGWRDRQEQEPGSPEPSSLSSCSVKYQIIGVCVGRGLYVIYDWKQRLIHPEHKNFLCKICIRW